MAERLWSYTELRMAYVKSRDLPAGQVAAFLNSSFHEGEQVRSQADVERVLKQGPIFRRPKRKKPLAPTGSERF